MAMLMIGGVEMPAPSSMKIALFDLSSGGERSAGGALVMDRLAVKRRLSLAWSCLKAADMARLLNAVEGSAFFTVEYPDPRTGGLGSMRCSCGDRAAGVLRMEGGAPVWTNVEMVFEEV